MQDPERSADVRIHPSSTAVVRFGKFFFDRDNHLLSTEDGEITLPPRVLAILDLLVERAGAVVAKETIMGTVWREACVGDTSLTEAISLLRQALGDNPRDPTFIQTVHRRGYRFVAAVEVVGRAGGPLARGTPLPSDPADGESQGPFPPLSRLATVIAATVAIGILIAGFWFARGRTEAPRADAEPIRLDVSSPQGVFVPFFTASALALSPDGDDLVFVGRLENGGTSLFRRRISEFESEAIPGTDDAGSPFFSPDGEWVAFFSEGELHKTPIGGGAVIPICESPFGFGGSWT